MLIDDDPCDAELVGAFTVTDNLSVYESDIDPPFSDTGIDHSTTDATDVTHLPMPLGSLGVWHQRHDDHRTRGCRYPPAAALDLTAPPISCR